MPSENSCNAKYFQGWPVDPTTPLDGQILAFVAALGIYVPTTGGGGGSGTVTSIPDGNTNGVIWVVANRTTTPTFTFILGNITPGDVAATGNVTGANLSGTNTGDQTITLTGDITGTGTGSFAATIAAGVIVNADINASAAIVISKLSGVAANGANADITGISSLTTLSTYLANVGTASPAIGSTTGVMLLLDNTTAATLGNGQATPVFRLSSNGWSQGSSASQDTTWQIGAVATSASSPGSTLSFQFSFNAGAFSTPMSITQGGTLTIAGTINGGAGINATGSVLCGSTSGIGMNSRSFISSSASGLLELFNVGGNGFTRANFGGATNSFNGIARDAVNGFSIQSAAGTVTYNDPSTANSGTVANRYIFGIAAPTLTSTGTSVTNTVASTLYIGGAPTDSTNTTSTTKWALNVAAGNTNLAGNTILGAPIRLKVYTVATLPAGTQGDTAAVSDSLAPTFLTTIAGGGAAYSVVSYNGANWVAA